MPRPQSDDFSSDDIPQFDLDNMELLLRSFEEVELPDFEIDTNALLKSFESIEIPSFEIDAEAFIKLSQSIDEAKFDSLGFNTDEFKTLLDSVEIDFTLPSGESQFESSEAALALKFDPNSTANDVANWMLSQLQHRSELCQTDVAYYILRHFGQKFVYKNRNKNWAISTDVLKEFLRLTQRTVVWNRRKRLWRNRKIGDPSNSRIVED